MSERSLDLVLFGATGFTGQLVAEYLYAREGAGSNLAWALAGRSEDKLAAVRQTLQGHAPQQPLELVVADSADAASLDALARRSRVICSTVGPYARYGSELVAACARHGTHYCDLTGEVPWIARMIAEHDETARASGARIVHCCGFDSIPSDLGTWFAQEQLQVHHGVYARRVRGRVGRTRGTASGGTVASLLGVVEEASRDATLRRELRDKYLLYPPGEVPGPKVSDQTGPRYDACFERWTAPFVMALINERVVRRSNALLDFPWGRDFDYDESMLCGSRAEALTVSLAMGAGLLTVGTAPGRALARKFLPAPGEGPDREAREKGFFELFFEAEHPEDETRNIRVKVAGDRDPGYGATSRMLGEAALCLAQDEVAVGGGIWTPASALARHLLPRLEEHAGLSFDVVARD
jgi:short subunit dehydrogenase-like uncharacterized protein